MALLSNIREKSPKFIIAGAAIIFIVLIIFDWGLDISNRKGGGMQHEILGTVNGQEVNYKQFSELLKRTLENQRKQQNTEIDAETERTIRSQVWGQMVDEMLIEQEIERLGITVTDQEIRDVIMGPNPPDFLVQQFKDSTGTFRRDAYQRAMMDPQNKDAWIEVENLVRSTQKRQKLQSLLMATANVSDDEIRQRFSDRTITMNANYILFDINRLVPDSTVIVTDDDMQKQYDLHAAEFHVKPMRKVKYVILKQQASPSDSADVLKTMEEILRDAKSQNMDFAELVKDKSDIPFTDAYYRRGELTKQKDDAIFAAKKGEIIGPITDDDGYHLIKILDQRPGKEEVVNASHILINLVSGPDSVKAIQKARALLAQARAGANFAALALENSQDYVSGRQGGELGWRTKNQWVKPFADVAFKARVGEIVGPVRSQFGWHIIKVNGREKREIKIVDCAMKVKASTETIDSVYQKAQDFVYLAKEEGFEKAAENSGIVVQETPEFQKTGSIPGLGQIDVLQNFAFKDKVGTISDPINIRDGIVIAKVSNIREEGVRPFDEVKTALKQMAMKQKKLDKIHDQVETFYKTLTPTTDFFSLAASNPNIIVQTTTPFKPNESPLGVGRDQKFVGTALSLKPGELSKPFEGIRGYYILQMISKTPFDTTEYKIERESLYSQLLQEKRNRVIADWHTALLEKADIVDNRDKFFR